MEAKGYKDEEGDRVEEERRSESVAAAVKRSPEQEKGRYSVDNHRSGHSFGPRHSRSTP